MYFTGNDKIDALLDNAEPHWAGPGTFGTGVSLTYSFATSSVPTAGRDRGQSFFTAAQKAAARDALEAWADVANIKFTEITDTGVFLGNGKGRGDINFINESLDPRVFGGDTLAFAFFPFGPQPRQDERPGDVHVNQAANENFTELKAHQSGLLILLHEIGHALGLTHPSDSSAGLPFSEDNDRFTVMSAFLSDNVFADAGVFAAGPMLYDILAIQHLYGKNMTHRTGNDTYKFDDDDVVYETIWDAGGIDRISVAGSNFRAIIDLRAGRFSSVVESPDGSGAADRNLAIAFGATIENATGGKRNDVIIGNNAANQLSGSQGNDKLSGGGGNDSLDGGSGADRMSGGMGNDIFVLDRATDVIVEAKGGGIDTVISAISFTLPGTLERLTLIANAVNGTGNAAANVIRGNALANTLRGGDGNDTLVGGEGLDVLSGGNGDDRALGGAGNDRFIVHGGADTVIEDVGKGTDTVASLVGFSLPANVERLELLGTDAIAGTGNGLDNTIAGNVAANILTGGPGSDSLTGGDGGDTFRYVALADGAAVATDVVRGAVTGDTIADFLAGTDVFRFLAAAFDPLGAIGLGAVTLGDDFSIIGAAYDGTNPGANVNHGAGQASFIFSTADSTLYFDIDGGAIGGYAVVATLGNGATPGANDIEIVAA